MTTRYQLEDYPADLCAWRKTGSTIRQGRVIDWEVHSSPKG